MIITACKDRQTFGTNSFDLTSLSPEDIQQGKKLFELQCVRCHGMFGRGGSAPSLNRSHLHRAPDDATLLQVIRQGIPGTEMPGTWLLSEFDARQVAGYVRSLAIEEVVDVRGNSDAGLEIFDTKGACRTCHMVGGQGGSLGSDLTGVGSRRSAEFIRRILIEPGFYKREGELANTRDGFIDNLVVEIETKSGKKFSGFRENEDAFTIQIRGADNEFYSFQKSELNVLRKVYESSVMPSVKDALDENELNDLVAYLVSLKST